jgi:hypothetical protein
LTQNKAKLCKILIITLVFEKNANFFAKNCQKSQKIVIITSTPGANPTTFEFKATYSASVEVRLSVFTSEKKSIFIIKTRHVISWGVNFYNAGVVAQSRRLGTWKPFVSLQRTYRSTICPQPTDVLSSIHRPKRVTRKKCTWTERDSVAALFCRSQKYRTTKCRKFKLPSSTRRRH